jgi:hypothetical protein
MVTPLDEFPLHVLSNILGDVLGGVNIDKTNKKDGQISALRVSSVSIYVLCAMNQRLMIWFSLSTSPLSLMFTEM